MKIVGHMMKNQKFRKKGEFVWRAVRIRVFNIDYVDDILFLWIDGKYGVGKTTVANTIKERASNNTIEN